MAASLFGAVKPRGDVRAGALTDAIFAASLEEVVAQAPSDTARYGTEMARWPVTLNDTRALPCSIATVLVASAVAAAGVLASA